MQSCTILSKADYTARLIYILYKNGCGILYSRAVGLQYMILIFISSAVITEGQGRPQTWIFGLQKKLQYSTCMYGPVFIKATLAFG